MTLSRRQLLLGTAGLAGGAAMGTRAARATPSDRAIGTGRLTTLSDGHLTLPGDFIFDPMPQQDLAAVLDDYSINRDRLTPECNLALYRDGDRVVLFDLGAGPDFMPGAGQLADSFAALDLSPDDITHVVITHAHPDHLWGLLDDFDDPVFPDATYMMGAAEWDYWWDPETVDRIGADRTVFAVGARRRMEVIEDRVIRIADGDEILPGIAALATPGHTPGHMSFEIRQGADAALITGDAIANHHVAFRRPLWPSGSDQDRDLAAATRARLLDRITADGMHVVGFHLPGGGMGRVEMDGDGYRFVEDTA